MIKVLDETGKEIQEYDVLRVFHFIGARGKRHYMYKFVIKREGELFAKHLSKLEPGESEGYVLWPSCNDLDRIEGTRILT